MEGMHETAPAGSRTRTKVQNNATQRNAKADKGNEDFQLMTLCIDLCSFAPGCGASSQNPAKEPLAGGCTDTVRALDSMA